MHIVLVSGSHRENSQSSRIAHYFSARMKAVEEGVSTDIIDLKGNPLPLWDERAWQPDSELQRQWQPYAERLRKADGFVIVSPEWSGMVPAGLKNFFLYASAREIGHKPGLIVTVSSSRGGSYPVEELRTSSYKNTRICYIPEHVIVRDAEKMFVGEQPDGDDDAYLRGRSDFALRCLAAYAKALKVPRESGVLYDKNYPFGM